jgi:hypothetical protein
MADWVDRIDLIIRGGFGAGNFLVMALSTQTLPIESISLRL